MLRLGTIGFDGGFLQSFSIALKNRSDGMYALAAEGEAQILLVDTDLAKEQEYLSRRLKRAVPMLAIVTDPESLGDAHQHFSAVLPKPLQFSSLMAAINALAHEHYAEHLSHLFQRDVEKPVAAVAQSVAAAASQIAKGVHSALRVERASGVVKLDEFLLGMVVKGLSWARTEPVYLVQWPGGAWLAIDRKSETVSMSLSPKVLRSLAMVRRTEQDLKSLDLTYAQFAAQRERAIAHMSLEQFLWSLTHWTVRSDRLDILDIDRAYRLKCWPNLTRYSVSEMDVPLANYWMTHPASVTELLGQLNVPVDKVLPFASCCLVAGFLEATDASRTSSRTGAQGKSNDIRGVLSSLLGRLSRKS